jgi:hypothetical protein
MSRQSTPDIMGAMMNGTATLIAVEQENNKAIKQENHTESRRESGDSPSESNKTIKLARNKAIKQDEGKGIIEMKEKATFNLTRSSLDTLEDTWIKLRRQYKGGQRITKTCIVEIALEICVNDFKQNGSDSMLCKKLADFRQPETIDDNIAP